MPVTIREHAESRRLEGPGRFVWRWTATGSSTIDDIATALALASPPNYGFWLRQWDQKTIVPAAGGGGTWDCEVPYGVGDIPLLSIGSLPGGSSGGTTGGVATGGSTPLSVSDGDPLGREWSLDFGQSSRLMTKSLKSFGGYRRALASEAGLNVAIAANDNGAVIGFNPDSRTVDGAEVPAGIARAEYQFKVPVLTRGFMKKLEDLICPEPHVNSEAFLGRGAREVRLVGANVAWSQANGFTIRLIMDVGKKRTVVVDPNLPNVELLPFDYLDVTYRSYPNTDGPAGSTIRLPERYVVHQVHPEADLNTLFS